MRKIQMVLIAGMTFVPVAAFAGDGGELDSAGALLIQAAGRLLAKLVGMF